MTIVANNYNVTKTTGLVDSCFSINFAETCQIFYIKCVY